MKQAKEGSDGVSIVCVFNDPAVRAECLDRSIDAYGGVADVDYIPIDNTRHDFGSAGAALNHGARSARHELVVFVHQDVYLHSIDRLIEAGSWLGDGGWSLLGACGVHSDGRVVGRMRDRTQIIGVSSPVPTDVDSVDEVLFMVRRSQILAEPLSEAPELAWHAYGVEYGMRMRAQGFRVGAVDAAITHNSLTINLAKLDVAHRYVGDHFPQQVPIRTTCGVIGSPGRSWRSLAIVRNHGWRLRWLKESVGAAKARRLTGLPVVLSDMRHDVDLLSADNSHPLHVVNVDSRQEFAEYDTVPLQLTRLGRPVIMQTVRGVSDISVVLAALPSGSHLLVSGLNDDDLLDVAALHLDGHSWIVGMYSADIWLLSGVEAAALPPAWSGPRSTPLTARPISGSGSRR